MKGYRELSIGFNQRNLVPVESEEAFATKVSNFIKDNPGKSLFCSLFTFDLTAEEYHRNNGYSIKGYSGKATTNQITFDFDSKVDPNLALQDAKTLIERLKVASGLDKIQQYIRVFFSGNKGFHICVLTGSTYTNEEVKSICSGLAKDLKTFDSQVYDKVRIFRIPNTPHQDTGLYKIELIPSLLKKENALAIIKAEAEHPKDKPIREEYKKITDTAFLDKFKNIVVEEAKSKSIIVDINESAEGIRGIDSIDFSECPKNMPKCIWALTKGIMVPGLGERHHIFLGLGNYYRNQGFPQNVVYNILKGIAKENSLLYPESKSYVDEIKAQIIPMVFSRGSKINTGGWGIDPSDPIFSRYCNALHSVKRCPIHNRDKYNKVIKIDEVGNSFADFAGNYERNIVKTGLHFIDKHVEFMRGTTNLLVGTAGTGKTSLLLDIMEKCNASGMYTFFASLDMSKNLVYLKLAMKLTGYRKHEIFEFFKDKIKYAKQMQEIQQAIATHYNRTFFDFSSTISLDDLKQRIMEVEDQNDIEIKLVAIDYASRLSGPYSDANANESFNALKIKEVADETNTAVVVVNQVARTNGDGSTPLRSKRVARGSSSWEDSCSTMITCWRPYMGMEERNNPTTGEEFRDDVIRLFIAKNRMGQELERPLWWDGAKSEIRDMSEEEYLDYKQNREPDELEAQRVKQNRV